MDARLPLSRRRRWLLHFVFATSALAALGYIVRLAAEPHAAFGVYVPGDRIVGHVAAGSAAQAAGVQVGDTLAAGEDLRWQSGPSPTTLRVRREGRVVTLAMEARAPTLAQRLAMLPWYRWVLLGVGLATLGIGWWVFTRNPDAPGMVPFVLWTALATLVFPMIGPSRVWTLGMWQIFVAWEIVFNGLYHAFTLHWLLLFPRRLAGPRVLGLIYGSVGVVIVGLLVGSFSPFRYPEAALHIRSAIVGLIVLGLCVVQFARAPSRRVRRQASWVLVAAAIYSVLDILLWEIPVLIGVNLGSTGATNAFVGLCYLVVPAGIAVAVTREGLFGIDRFVTPGLAYGISLLLLALAYAIGATFLSSALGASGSLPVGAGVALAVALAALLVPLQRAMLRALGRVFDRHDRRARETLGAFEAAAAKAVEADTLGLALAETVQSGLGLASCTLSAEPLPQIIAHPGALDVATSTGIHLDARSDATLAVPLPSGSGHLRLGPRTDGARFHDDDLELIAELGRRYALAAERIRLVRQLGARELDLAHTRLRIAGDLHDDIGASLSSMAVLSDLVRRNDELPPADRARLDRLSSSARDLVGDLRDIVWAIDPSADRVHDLAERLRDTASALLPGVRCTVVAPEAADLPLGMDTRRHLLLIAKEALHNVARHADATSVDIRLGVSDDALTLLIADDGCGFDTSAVSSGHGLGSLEKRAATLGGTVEIESAPGAGTRILLRAPRAAGGRRPSGEAFGETARSRPDTGGDPPLS